MAAFNFKNAATSATAALGVRGKPAELIAHYQDIDPIETDVLTCNGELVFSSVVVGRVLSLRPYDINRPQTRWDDGCSRSKP